MTDTAPVIPMTEIFEALRLMNDEKARLAGLMKTVDADIAEMRTAIEQRLRDGGATAHTDAATGMSARIEQRTTWKVTDRDALMTLGRQRPMLCLLVETLDEKRAIDMAKASDEPVPGIEPVVTESLVIRGGKG